MLLIQVSFHDFQCVNVIYFKQNLAVIKVYHYELNKTSNKEIVIKM